MVFYEPGAFNDVKFQPVAGPGKTHIVKRADGLHSQREGEEVLELSEELLDEITRGNGPNGMTKEEVREALMKGKTVYTTFSRYTRQGF